MSGKEPSVGYPFFAQLLVNTRHNIVITTNFDSLLESSIYRYTDSQPLVIGHENLAHFLNSSTERPIIAKIHRDILLDPKNDTKGTSSLPDEWQKPLKQILETTHIVVVGYGGNDGSLMDFLKTLENRNGIYWCVRESADEKLPSKVTDLLNQESDRIVNIPDFDGLMIELADIFECAVLVDKKDIKDSPIINKATLRAEIFQKQIDDYADANKASTTPDSTIQKLVSNWYDYQKKANATEDINEKDSIFREGIDETNHPSLIGNYAIFLYEIKKDYEAAERYYFEALQLEPDNAKFNGNYAIFLYEIKKDYDAAERYYLKALQLEPDNAKLNGNYASFLQNLKKDYKRARRYYLNALKLEPDSVKNNGNYALFLDGIEKDYEAADRYYLKALEVEPDNAVTNGNYAVFLKNVKNEYEAADRYYLRALQLEPENANINVNYALFLNEIKKDYESADRYFLKALQLEPDSANINVNYAGFLFTIGKKQLAEKHLELALIKANPEQEKDLLLECYFYQYAHIDNKMAEAEVELLKLLDEGITSPGFDLSQNVERATKEGHPFPDKLRDYANRITAI